MELDNAFYVLSCKNIKITGLRCMLLFFLICLLVITAYKKMNN